ncbi:CocE/NonD family hydrolase [Pseudonocardia ailaonensis]|uniref:CocE/NonD family hydrolase n=1 Tax=Pseudonocardia ailaonensis TaxID=367279 RepID=A0ABN2NN16_9PSEU
MQPFTGAVAALLDKALGLPPGKDRYESEAFAVPMPDGVTLLGRRYRPSRAEGPQPVVLVRNPYGPQMEKLLLGGPLARHGFQVFVQATRGTFGSGGQFRPFTSERADGLATVDWLREQPWCDGRIATTGPSYLGHTQWLVAPHADPPLVAVSPHITASRMTETFYPGGAPTLLNGLAWTATIGRQEIPRAVPDPRRKAVLKKALRRIPLQTADIAVAGAPVGFWRDFTSHGEPGDPYWPATYGEPAADLAKVPPANMVTGWWDLFIAAQMHDFADLQAAGVPARIVVGPWLHGEFAEFIAMMKADLPWLEHHLNGGPEPEGAPVRLFLQEADQWLEFDSWPPPAEPHTVPLGRGSFVYDPSDPTPAVGGPLLQPPGKQEDQQPVESRPDVLVFTGEPLAEDLDVVGAPVATVHVRPELEHADVYVRVCDVDAKGVSRNVVDGIRRLDPHTVPAKDVTVGEDGALTVEIELFPTAYRFRAGHRIRVQVAGGAFPRYARNVGTGEPFGAATTGRRCRTEVLDGGLVELPVLRR